LQHLSNPCERGKILIEHTNFTPILVPDELPDEVPPDQAHDQAQGGCFATVENREGKFLQRQEIERNREVGSR
jgi:hypothetical protein